MVFCDVALKDVAVLVASLETPLDLREVAPCAVVVVALVVVPVVLVVVVVVVVEEESVPDAFLRWLSPEAELGMVELLDGWE